MTLIQMFSASPAIHAVGTHLWQSTLFAAVIGLTTLAFRRNTAAVRHALWLAASIKFLVPFAALVAIGSQFGFRAPVSVLRSEIVVVEDTVGRPFSPLEIYPPAPTPTLVPGGALRMLPSLAWTIWIATSILVLGIWWVRWRRVAAIAQASVTINSGRELDVLRRLERMASLKRSTALVSSDSSLEPGVFGVLRPVLVWPRAISPHLDDQQVETILAHEVSHVRRRDNLAAAIHMLVEALFWFHPLVWWIGARLVDERERACDEDVLVSGNEPEVYAETILIACRLYVESPLPCVAGVTGSDLKKRIERIMTNNATERLTMWRKLVLMACAVATITAPILVGAATAPRLRSATRTARAIAFQIAPNASRSGAVQAQDAGTKDLPQFEVASIKPNKSGDGRVMLQIQPGGRFIATNVTLRLLIRNAYLLQDFQIVGGPSWLNEDHFDVVAKAESDGIGDPFQSEKRGEPSRGQLMLRSLLGERFKFVAHSENRDMPIFALLLNRSDGKLGPHMKPSEVDCEAMMGRGRGRGPVPPAAPSEPRDRVPCGIRVAPGNMAVGGASMTQFASSLGMFVGRVVVDKTGLAGNYEFNLTWTPELPARPAGAPEPLANGNPIDPNGPSIFTAVQEQLGLKLDSQKGPVSVLVIDRAEHPIEN